MAGRGEHRDEEGDEGDIGMRRGLNGDDSG